MFCIEKSSVNFVWRKWNILLMNQECYITCEGGTERKPAFKIKTLQMLVLQFVAANGKFWTLTQQGVVINMFMLYTYMYYVGVNILDWKYLNLYMLWFVSFHTKSIFRGSFQIVNLTVWEWCTIMQLLNEIIFLFECTDTRMTEIRHFFYAFLISYHKVACMNASCNKNKLISFLFKTYQDLIFFHLT